MDLGEIGWGGVEWIRLAHDRDKRRVLVKNTSVALARERTIPTKRQPLVGKVVPAFADRGVLSSQGGGSPTTVISVF
jgi:hypothetical protein